MKVDNSNVQSSLAAAGHKLSDTSSFLTQNKDKVTDLKENEKQIQQNTNSTSNNGRIDLSV